VLCLASCHGLAILRRLNPGLRLLRTERIALVGGIGLAVQSLITLSAGLAGQLNPTAICLPSLLSLILAWRWRNSEPCLAEPCSSNVMSERPSAYLVGIVLMVIVPFVVYLLLGSLSPPTDFDVREYHLQGPKEWFQQGQISYLRHNVYTSFPFLSEMLPLTAMVLVGDWWEGALAGQAVLACFQLLTACVVFAICTRWLSTSVAWLATLIYLTTPWTLRISLIAYAEGALTFYLISSAMVAFWSIEQIGHRRSLSFWRACWAAPRWLPSTRGLCLSLSPPR
jgi:MFS family permease